MKYAIFVLELICALSLFINPTGTIKKPKSYWTVEKVRKFQILGLVLAIQSIVALIIIIVI